MKNSKAIFWSLIVVGTLGLFSSIFSFANGADFNTYFWGGFCGITLIGTALLEEKKKQDHIVSEPN
jgi:hypothetical protein